MKPTSQPGRFRETELGMRIMSAIVLIVIVLVAAWLGGFVFALVCALLSGLIFYEWQRMVSLTPFDTSEAILTAGFVFLVLLCLLGAPLAGLIVMVAIGIVMEITSHGAEKSDVRWIGLGALYCAIPVFALPVIREQWGFSLLLFVFLVVWITDIAAYFTGRHFGGAKLMPAVSPKKTWSGAIGGLVAAAMIGLLYVWWIDARSPALLVALAVLLSVASQAGDLFESWVKRRYAVKDSGNLIPGHGGFLDRVDGLVAAALVMAVMVLLSMT